MAAKHARHVASTAPLIAFVEGQLAEGGYTSIRDVVGAALRLMSERDAAKSQRGPATFEAVHDRA